MGYKDSKKAWQERNKEKLQDQARGRWADDPEYYRDKASRYRKANRDLVNLINRRSYIKTRYGISLEEYNERLENQNYKCAICGADISEKRKQQLDHNHETGAVRDFLCKNCNTALGGFQDSKELLMRAVSYLERHCRGELSSQ